MSNVTNPSARSIAGKKGASARWGKDYVHENDNNMSDDDEEKQGNEDYGGKDPRRVAAGKKAAGHQSHEDFVERGRKGAAARWGHINGNMNDEDYDISDESSEDNGGKNPRRVAPGKRGSGQLGHYKLSEISHNGGKSRRTGGGGPRTVHDEDDLRQEDIEEDEGRGLHDFQPGKNPRRVAVGKRVAAERGHQALAEQGRKGGHGNKGIHADINYDDMESYLDNPESGVPAKNPNRVAGGRRAASQQSHEDFVERGRKGGLSRAGQPRLTQGNIDDEYDKPITRDDLKDSARVQGGKKAASHQSHEDFVERGRKGAAARWGGQHHTTDEEDQDEGDYGVQRRGSGGRNKNQSHADLSLRGKMGASARWGKDYVHENDNNMSDDNEEYEGNEDYGGKDPRRVAAGKKAASNQSHEDFVERGRKGAAARWGYDYEINDEDDEYDHGYEGKDPRRVAAGKKAASHRTHADFAEMGHKGGLTRWHGGGHHQMIGAH